jgi:hypothetical protein
LKNFKSRQKKKANFDHASDIAVGNIERKPFSSVRFIEKTSGIKAGMYIQGKVF